MKKHALFVHALIAAATLPQATPVHASEDAHRGAIAANWCNYLGPDCRPRGLSARGRDVFVYLTQGSSAPGIIQLRASHELSFTRNQVARGEPKACSEVGDIVRAMQQSPSADIRQLARKMSELADTHCH